MVLEATPGNVVEERPSMKSGLATDAAEAEDDERTDQSFSHHGWPRGGVPERPRRRSEPPPSFIHLGTLPDPAPWR